MIPERKLTRALETEGIDAVVASSPTNVFYLSGLESLTQDLLGERAFAVRAVTGGGPHLVLPAIDASIIVDDELDYEAVHTYGSFFLYEGASLDDADEHVLRLKDERNHDDVTDALAAAVEPLVGEGSRIALEQTGLSPAENRRIEAELDVRELRPAGSLLARLRRVKTREEQSRLRRAVGINQDAIRATVEDLEPGTTERELANRYREELCARGAEPLFTVIGFGTHGAYPHAVPGDRPLRAGDLVRFDVGCTYRNYASDIARTFAFRSADESIAQRYRVLYEGMERAVDLLAGGRDTADVFEGTLDHIRASGAFDAFDRNHVGHGIGIEVYDPPTITAEHHEVVPGMVMCVEPPYYELGTGGLQVEDEVLVTADGTERLSQCPDRLRVLD